ncbi:methanethiol S-methyltransferase [Reichenbachiella sp.]|uniref:methanethiol S-methyltransferase n=1 Tax=Reichenbachiella sp. TaxID=2184521 RepID=UPI003B59DDF3
MKRILFFIYGVASYAVGVFALLYLIAFLGDMVVPKTIDGPSMTSTWKAIGINLSLILLFSVQHSVMARLAFKKRWTQFVSPVVERSTYVLFTFFALITLFYFWQPLGGEVWNVASGSMLYNVLYGLFFSGWAILFSATFLINHFDLFGLRQVYLHLIGKDYTPLVFKEKGFYKSVRHPIYSGLLLGLWCTPHMTVSHLFLAVLWTVYVFYAINLEERDLIKEWGDKYQDYKNRTGSVFPKLSKKRAVSTKEA